MNNRLWQWMVKPVLSALAGAIFVVSVGTATVAVKGRKTEISIFNVKAF